VVPFFVLFKVVLTFGFATFNQTLLTSTSCSAAETMEQYISVGPFVFLSFQAKLFKKKLVNLLFLSTLRMKRAMKYLQHHSEIL